MDACNVHQVFDWLWSSGQISAADIREIQKAGFDCVINLALPTSANALMGEADLVAGSHMTYLQIPIEWELPEIEQFLFCVDVLENLRQRKQKVWLHCVYNNRVSAFIYLYRKLILGEDEDKAVHPMNEVWTVNEVWQEFIKEVISRFVNK